MQIGSVTVEGNLVLAPMAGVTDEPYRRICRKLGASLTVGEMAAADAHLQDSLMTRRRFTVDADDPCPVVQILGADPDEMARAARQAQAGGARIIDINFGCPARVVCGKACGSALMKTPELAKEILSAVADAVSVPVTVKMRLGWDESTMNAEEIALAAQEAGFALVTVHGRTRAQRFAGKVNREAIARVVKVLSIPVVANGDVVDPQMAVGLLKDTGAAGVMIGRGAYGNPWIFERTKALLETGTDPGMPSRKKAGETVLEHFQEHVRFWMRESQSGDSELTAIRNFRKHARWYMARFADAADDSDAVAMQEVVRADTVGAAQRILTRFFDR